MNKLVLDHKFNEARLKANEIFINDEKKLKETLETIRSIQNSQERINKSTQELIDTKNKYDSIQKLEIQSGYTDKIKGDYYYITGSVKNIGNADINYFEVRVDFKDNEGNILDSDYTNDGLVLKSGEMREFEIMHKYNNKYKQYSLSIGDVK